MRDPALGLALLAAGCASAPARDHTAPALFRTATTGTPATPFQAALPKKPVPVEPELPPAPGARKGVSLEIRFALSDGTTVLAPRIVAYSGRRANAQVLRQTSFISDFDVEKKDGAAIANPIIGLLDDGIRLDMVPRLAEGGTLLSWSLRCQNARRPIATESFTDLQGNRCTIQLPTLDVAEAGGVRALAEGVWGLLARLPDGKGGTLEVTARATAVDVEFSSAEEDARDIALVDEGAKPASPEPLLPEVQDRPGAPGGSLELLAVTLASDLPAGSVLDEFAAAAADVEALEPGALSLVTHLVPGARAAVRLDEAYVREYRYAADPAPETVDPEIDHCVSGLEAAVGEDGDLALSWTTTPRWDRFRYAPAGHRDPRQFSLDRPASETYRARVSPAKGARLVLLAPLPGGRAAAVLVRFRPE